MTIMAAAANYSHQAAAAIAETAEYNRRAENTAMNLDQPSPALEQAAAESQAAAYSAAAAAEQAAAAARIAAYTADRQLQAEYQAAATA